MNYNISFSRLYIPTDRAYWRVLIAFNSLLVHSYNGSRETRSCRYDRFSLSFSLSLSSIDPSRSDRPVLPLRAIPFFFSLFLSLSLSTLHRSPQTSLLVVEIIILLFFSLRRRA